LGGGWDGVETASIEKQQNFFWVHLAQALKTEVTALELSDEPPGKHFASSFV